MKRILSGLVLAALLSGSAFASPTQPHLTQVRATHAPVTKHKAHKAGKHHVPKHRRHRTV